MLHYSNASSIEKNRRYLVIKGGACLVALASRGRQQRSRSGHQQLRRSRSLPKRRGGRNSKHTAMMQQGCKTCLNVVPGWYTTYLSALVILGIYLDLFY